MKEYKRETKRASTSVVLSGSGMVSAPPVISCPHSPLQAVT